MVPMQPAIGRGAVESDMKQLNDEMSSIRRFHQEHLLQVLSDLSVLLNLIRTSRPTPHLRTLFTEMLDEKGTLGSLISGLKARREHAIKVHTNRKSCIHARTSEFLPFRCFVCR
jgi:hypothetical protein